MITSVKSILKTTPEHAFAAVSDPFTMEKWYSGMSDVKEITNFLKKGSVFTCKINFMGKMRFEFNSFSLMKASHDSVMWLGKPQTIHLLLFRKAYHFIYSNYAVEASRVWLVIMAIHEADIKLWFRKTK
ncbi:MAG: hypothetical protein IPP34_08050 [Bacteroidetes bacterium]|nr:hypothetical protein [Bacteroidota bacterium]